MGIETIAIMAIVAGAGISAYSSYEQGQSQKAISNYNAQVAENEAKQRAQDAQVAANAQRAQNEALKAKQRALFAKAGVVAAGTPLLVQAEQAATLEMSALEIERTGNMDAARLRSQAELDRMQGKSAARAGTMQAAGTVLSGVGSAGAVAIR